MMVFSKHFVQIESGASKMVMIFEIFVIFFFINTWLPPAGLTQRVLYFGEFEG